MGILLKNAGNACSVSFLEFDLHGTKLVLSNTFEKRQRIETTKFDQKTPCQIAFQNLCFQIMVFFLFALSFFYNNACQDASPKSEKLKARHGSCSSQIGCARAPLAQECTLSSNCTTANPHFSYVISLQLFPHTQDMLGPSISWSDRTYLTLPDEMRGSIHELYSMTLPRLM